ncbi:tail assembly chaperone [Mycobacterium phage SlimJimmy]|uniref:Tail assembly chaperone n=1 Tax=Mycobacterium phage Bricole TaxID=1718601 RepID=A0A0M4RBW9_9CAUD|nr:tail assembly chaperone [Mycobacterium phage Bricole]WMI33206.1 tail assembly chaperone [Mycobacterium phage SlimJimmy]
MATRSTKASSTEALEEEVDEVWAKLQTENHIPPLTFKGLTFNEPTKAQIDAWRAAKTVEEGERALFGDLYDAVHELFDPLPQHIWENFNVLYLKHMFGTSGDDALKRVIRIVDRYWSAICWDCQHILHFSAHEYFQWEHVGYKADGSAWWQRKRPLEELLGFFETLMNMPGSLTNEAVLLDPETIEWMGSSKDSDDGSKRPRIFGHTELVSLIKTGIYLASGQQLPRPVIPGLELRTQRKVLRIQNSVSAAQDRAKALAEKRAKKAKKTAKD